MRLQRTRNACADPLTLVMIVAYGLMALFYARRIPRPDYQYHGQGIAMLASQRGCAGGQCSNGSCSAPSYAPASFDDRYITGWVLPAYSNQPWVYQVSGQEVGRVAPDGSITGFAAGLPGTWPSNMPPTIQMRAMQVVQAAQTGQQKPTGDQSSTGQNVIGQDKPTGVNKDKLEEHKRNVPSGFTMNGIVMSEADWKAKLSAAAKSGGVKDFDQYARISIIGSEEACQPYQKVVNDLPKTTRDKILVDWYDPKLPEDEHHITAHMDAVKGIVKDLKPGKAIAYVQFADGTTPAITVDPGELRTAVNDLRSDHAEGFDAAKARVGFKTTDDIIAVSMILLVLGFPLLIWANK